ncbi:MAG: dehypoxanthine futalosine cyclase, partial [Candidatus Thermoplasmatota archaeon]|nr:dehypoxanthine futalosine cyclase [Candidatus Thermoplasmatota archaeon]
MVVSDILRAQMAVEPSRITVEEAILLYEEADLSDLMHVASSRRSSIVPGNEVTYLVDRNINYTNACTINCQFCSFYRPPDHTEAYTQTF